MKIDVCSDLHVPKQGTVNWSSIKNQGSSILLVAGDISDSIFKSAEVLCDAAKYYDRVIAVLGNHDFYDYASPTNGASVMRSLTSGCHGIVTVLGGSQVETRIRLSPFEELSIVGDTGWYDWRSHIDLGISEKQAYDSWQQYMNDAIHINFDGMTPQDYAEIQAKRIRSAISEGNTCPSVESIIVMTHMVPRQDLTYEHPTNMIWNSLTPSYVNTGLTDISDVNTNRKVKYHVYGHTHMRGMSEINDIIYLNNACGMRDENIGWFMAQIDV